MKPIYFVFFFGVRHRYITRVIKYSYRKVTLSKFYKSRYKYFFFKKNLTMQIHMFLLFSIRIYQFKNKLTITLLEPKMIILCHRYRIKHVIPCSLSRPFKLLAIWPCYPLINNGPFPIWKVDQFIKILKYFSMFRVKMNSGKMRIRHNNMKQNKKGVETRSKNAATLPKARASVQNH